MKRTYFDNTNVSENFEETKTFLQDANPESIITDEQVWNELSEIEREDWNDCLQQLKNLFAGRKCIAYGTIGTWMGNRKGAKMFDDVRDAIAAIVKDCEYITIESSDEGTIKVTASHHDGTHHMELKAVNAAGSRHADAWERKCDYNVSEYDMLERIWNSNVFSHKFTDEDILRG